MRALVADLGLARAGFTLLASRVRHDAAWQRGGILRERHLTDPASPGRAWVRVQPTHTGICGSDLKLLHVTGFSPLLAAYNPSARMIPGHELTGVVTGSAPGSPWHEGDLVIVEPTLACMEKGLPPCRRCRAGEGHVCENLAEAGDVCTGQGIGFGERLGGGWSDMVWVHESRLHDAGGIDPLRAVTAEPAAVAAHGVLRWGGSGDRVAVIGPGTLGLLTVMALRRIHPGCDISMVGPDVKRFDPTRSHAAGADRVWHGGAAEIIEHAAHHLGTTVRRPRFGGTPVLDGGMDAVFDCVGSADSLALAMRLLRARGELILIGTTASVRVDWSLLWWRELVVRGVICYGDEVGGARTFTTVRDWMRDDFASESLVTHTYALDDYAGALNTASRGPAAGAVKVVMTGWRSRR